MVPILKSLVVTGVHCQIGVTVHGAVHGAPTTAGSFEVDLRFFDFLYLEVATLLVATKTACRESSGLSN